MPSEKNIQNLLLNSIRRTNQSVTIYLTNGFQIRGEIEAFDSFVIVIKNEDKQQIIYKHAVSTIVPSKNIELEEHSENVEKN